MFSLAMPIPSVFKDRKSELEGLEMQMGQEAGRLALTMDLLTDALVMALQHGVYCQSSRRPGMPAMDIQIIHQNLEQAKELVSSVMLELKKR